MQCIQHNFLQKTQHLNVGGNLFEFNSSTISCKIFGHPSKKYEFLNLQPIDSRKAKNSLNLGKTKKQPVRSFTGSCKKKSLVISRQHFAANFASKTRNLKFPLFLVNCALMF